MVQSNLFYDFGRWGYYTSSVKGKVMPGFIPRPPDIEICGEYDIFFAVAIDDSNSRGGEESTKICLRMTTQGRLTISECSKSFPVSIMEDGSTRQRKIRANTMISASVQMPEWGHPTWPYFGPGYNFLGFAEDSNVSKCYSEKPANACPIVTKKNNNLGRMYVVSERKAFCRIEREAGFMTKELPATNKLQKQEALEAETRCTRRHFSFLCQHKDLPCEIARLITRFVVDDPPFLFTEPGDIWIDIRSTYVLARRRWNKFRMPPMTIHKIEILARNVKNEFMQRGDEKKMLLSFDKMKSTPDAGLLFVQLCVKYYTGGRCKDVERKAILSMLSVLYKNKKLTSGDIRGGVSCFFTNYSYYVLSGREPRAIEYVCDMISEFLHVKAIDVRSYCEILELPHHDLVGNSFKQKLISRSLVSSIRRYNIAEAKKHFGVATETLNNCLGAAAWHGMAVKHGLHRRR